MKNELDSLFHPNSIAVFGARPEPNRVGYALVENLLLGKPRSIFPISSEFDQVLGLTCHRSILEVNAAIDLALIAVKASDVPQALRDCAAKNVPNVIIISAGFKEEGPEGKKLEEEVTTIANQHHITLLGPNCLGIIDANADLNASFIAKKPLRGGISMLSQSGAIGTSFLDWSNSEQIGIAKFISLGNEAGITENAMLEYLGNDPDTNAILLYLEHISDGTEFLRIAKQISQKKPLVVLRAGQSARGQMAVMSHTGSLAPEDKVFAAAMMQSGIITVSSLRQLFHVAKLFTLGITAPLPHIAILTNGGGPSVNAADLVELSSTLSLTSFDSDTTAQLRSVLPPMAAVGNPIDVIGDASATRYEKALEILVHHPLIDVILVIVTPQMMTDSRAIAEVILKYRTHKPLVPILMGGASVQPGIAYLHESGMVNFSLPHDAIESLDLMGNRNRSRNDSQTKERATTRTFRSSVMLSYEESKELLAQYGVEIFGTYVEKKESLADAWPLNNPDGVAMKVISRDVVHKTELQAVRLNISDPEQASAVWDEMEQTIKARLPDAKIDGMLLQPMLRGKELIIGAKRDATFGPIVVFGLGGIFTELLKDVSMRVAPIDETEALSVIKEISGVTYLGAFRGSKPVDQNLIADLIAKVSRLMAEHPEISEIDLNPVIATSDQLFVVDARLMKA